jgi:hypothetical protein
LCVCLRAFVRAFARVYLCVRARAYVCLPRALVRVCVYVMFVACVCMSVYVCVRACRFADSLFRVASRPLMWRAT